MANNDVKNVAVGKPKIGGSVAIAATTATLPTDSTTALDAAFENLGYCSEDGLTQEINRESEDIKAWGGDTVLVAQTDYSETYHVTLIETLRLDVKKAVFGDANVTGALSTGITTIGNSKDLPEKAWVFDMIQNGATVRKVLPNARVTEIDGISYTDSEAVGYGLTIRALPDATGNCSYEYAMRA